jgi:hypothetical protein
MRDLLFRVFDKELGLMSEHFTLGERTATFITEDGDGMPQELESDIWDCLYQKGIKENNVVMQWTGLYDGTKWEQLTEAEQKAWLDKGKTKEEWPGKMIFEGDIVNYLGEGLFLIDIGELGFFRHLNDESGDMDIIPDRLLERSSSFEILGNVHEHKHLLDSSLEDKCS